MNSGGIKAFNAEYDKTFGNSKDQDHYIRMYEQKFTSVMNHKYNTILMNDISTNRGYKRIQKAVEKYGDKSYKSFLDTYGKHDIPTSRSSYRYDVAAATLRDYEDMKGKSK